MTPLCELARKHETDKGGNHYRYGGGDSDTCHQYTPVYHRLLGEDRDAVKNVLEIGINAGSSLRMWKEYFPFAQISGIDCDAKCLVHDEPRIKCYMADQNNPAQLEIVMATIGKLNRPLFDVIIDDGSHVREHQITSMKTLLPYLEDWGWYIIEDLGTSEEEPWGLQEAVPEGYEGMFQKIVGGLGPKVQPHEWLFLVRRKQS